MLNGVVYSRVGLFFFFRQKTAYEMRISDWSSDVCSSDLWPRQAGRNRQGWRSARPQAHSASLLYSAGCPLVRHRGAASDGLRLAPVRWRRAGRSEEHTSELQSLMRISYAVFCLKKKTNKQIKVTTSHRQI